jgi:hypothetical protein
MLWSLRLSLAHNARHGMHRTACAARRCYAALLRLSITQRTPDGSDNVTVRCNRCPRRAPCCNLRVLRAQDGSGTPTGVRYAA